MVVSDIIWISTTTKTKVVGINGQAIKVANHHFRKSSPRNSMSTIYPWILMDYKANTVFWHIKRKTTK